MLTYALVASQRDSFAGLSGLAAVVGFAAAAADHLRQRLSDRRACYYWHLPPVAPIWPNWP